MSSTFCKKHSLLFFPAIWGNGILFLLISLSGCLGPYIDRHITLRPAPPHTGSVDVRIHPQGSSGQVLFQTHIFANRTDQIPEKGFVDIMRARAAKLGANVLVFKCDTRLETGYSPCELTGYLEAGRELPCDSRCENKIEGQVLC